jgi:hypothetical protein
MVVKSAQAWGGSFYAQRYDYFVVVVPVVPPYPGMVVHTTTTIQHFTATLSPVIVLGFAESKLTTNPTATVTTIIL